MRHFIHAIHSFIHYFRIITNERQKLMIMFFFPFFFCVRAFFFSSCVSVGSKRIS